MASTAHVNMCYDRLNSSGSQKSNCNNNNESQDYERTPDGGYKIKTFYPTREEMKDFSAFMRKVHDQGGHRAGLAKIVPPADYKPRKAGYDDDALYDMEISCPIKQNVSGEGGLYQQLNVVEKKKMTVKAFKRLSETKHPTPEHRDPSDMDRIFWKNIFVNPAIYGADVSGTLYDEDCEEFNLTKLNTILDNIRDDYGVTIQGVNTTYLYFGMWKSSFCWHTEDMDLYSINYLHTGQPKSWYCIAPEYGKRFERLAASFFPHSFKNCRAFLRHKTTLISPQVLKKYSIPFSRITQNVGEFMVTFPYSYHSGYNQGFNIAEATNFALEYWVEFGKWATRCECSSESVKISMQTFVKRYQSDRYENWIRGRDICKDPRDLRHAATAAPKPTEYDLYLMGSHERPEEEPQFAKTDRKRKIALQASQSSNVKARSKQSLKPKKSNAEKSYLDYLEYLKSNGNNDSSADEVRLPHFDSLPTEMLPGSEAISLSSLIIPETTSKVKPNYDKLTNKNKRLKLSADRKRLKNEKRAQERIISCNQLLHFLPQSFTLEKKFNRCVSTMEPHCSVCQLFIPHPKDNEDVWGLRVTNTDTKSNDSSQVVSDSGQTQDTTSPESPAPQAALPQVEKPLPTSSKVLIPSRVFVEALPPTIDELNYNLRQNLGGAKDESNLEDEVKPDDEIALQNELDPEPQPKSESEFKWPEVEENEDDQTVANTWFLDVDFCEPQELLQCSLCMLTVHKLCYGINKPIENKRDWTCDRCSESNRSLISCALCPCRGGALKLICGLWVHITCALSVHGVNYIDIINPSHGRHKLEPPELSEKNQCVYCSKNYNLSSKYVKGRCVSCVGCFNEQGEHIACSNTFHVTCGHRNGAEFDFYDHYQSNHPIRVMCAECSQRLFDFRTQIEQSEKEKKISTSETDMDPLPINSQVIVRQSNGSLVDGYIEERLAKDCYEIFYPSYNETEFDVPSKRIADFDPTREFKLGDSIQIKGFRLGGDRTGKFKERRTIVEYLVRLRSKRSEKFARKDIYLNCDQLSLQDLELYQRRLACREPAVKLETE